MSKKIDFSISSFVDLKAELHKKQQDFAKKKSANINTLQGQAFANNKKSILNVAKMKVDAATKYITAKDRSLTEEVEKKLDQSKKRLIEKAAMYEQLSSGQAIESLLDDEGKSLCLVDFERKKYEQSSDENDDDTDKEQVHCQAEPTCSKQSNNDDQSDVSSEDEFVEFVDSFGRTRRCMRRDLDSFKANDRKCHVSKTRTEKNDAEPKVVTASSDSTVSNESNQKAEEPTVVHYQHVSKDEIWDRGAGYYQFSGDEVERQQQLKRLNELRQQTLDKRKSVEQLKDKRKQIMEQRLARVKERKRLIVDMDIEDSDDAPPVNLEDIRLPDETETDVEAKKIKIDREAKRAAHVRPWDMGKTQTTFSQNDWAEKQRQERYSEFAPPSTYFAK